jgi:hypothetical protein
MVRNKIIVLLSLGMIILFQSVQLNAWFRISYEGFSDPKGFIRILFPKLDQPYIVDLFVWSDQVQTLTRDEVWSIIEEPYQNYYASYWNGVKDSDGFVSARLHKADTFHFETNHSPDSFDKVVSVLMAEEGDWQYKIVIITEEGIYHTSEIFTQTQQNAKLEFRRQGYRFMETDSPFFPSNMQYFLNSIPSYIYSIFYVVGIMIIKLLLLMIAGYRFSKQIWKPLITQLIYATNLILLLSQIMESYSYLAGILLVMWLTIYLLTDILLTKIWLNNRSYLRPIMVSVLTLVFAIASMALVQMSW